MQVKHWNGFSLSQTRFDSQRDKRNSEIVFRQQFPSSPLDYIAMQIIKCQKRYLKRLKFRGPGCLMAWFGMLRNTYLVKSMQVFISLFVVFVQLLLLQVFLIKVKTTNVKQINNLYFITRSNALGISKTNPNFITRINTLCKDLNLHKRDAVFKVVSTNCFLTLKSLYTNLEQKTLNRWQELSAPCKRLIHYLNQTEKQNDLI